VNKILEITILDFPDIALVKEVFSVSDMADQVFPSASLSIGFLN